VSLYAYLFTNGRQGVGARELSGGTIADHPATTAKAAKAANCDVDEVRRIDRARSIYAAGGPIGGAAKAYLLSRGLQRVPAWERLRTSYLRHPEAGEHPAIIAPVTGASGALEGFSALS
jgi:hypothetical protein